MLTNFFSKSKPINFIILSLYLILGYLFWVFFKQNEIINVAQIAKNIGITVSYLFLLFLLNFIIAKNKLSNNSTYGIALFSGFLLLSPSLFIEKELLFANIFLLLALRRIISLTSEKNTKKKILDAAIWISIASLFYFWSLLFFIVLYMSIFLVSTKISRLLLIPFVGFLSVFILTTVYYLLTDDNFLWFLSKDTSISFDFSSLLLLKNAIPTLFLTMIAIISIFYRKFNKTIFSLKEKTKNILLFYWLLISFIIIIISPNKTAVQLVFSFAPLSIFASSLIETISKKWLGELLLLISFILPSLYYIL